MKLPKGNIDPTGEYFIWTGNAGTNRLDAFVVRLPPTQFTPVPPPTPIAPAPPAPAPTPTPAPQPAPAPPPASPTSPGIPVTWTSLVNVSSSGGELKKTGGCGGCADAGAVSTQRISSGAGTLSFNTTDTQTLRFVGLGSGGAGTTAAEIAFALRLQNGTAEVREAGVYRSEVGFAASDTLTIAVDAGVVSYAKNGAVFYTSAAKASYPLAVDTSFYDLNGTISSATITTTTVSATTSTVTGAGSRPSSGATSTTRKTATPVRSPRRRG
jgi:hypothetical protein